MNATEWLEDVKGLPGRLANIDKDAPNGDMRATLELWHTLGAAPSSIVMQYESFTEAEVLDAAERVTSVLGEPAFGFPASMAGFPRDSVLAIAAHLRALDLQMSSLGSVMIPADPADEYLVRNDRGDHFLIPLERRLWRTTTDPSSDKRPFRQRGLIKHRILPSEVDGAAVKLIRARRFGGDEGPSKLGAALFPDLDLVCDDNAESFLVTGVTCPRLDPLIAAAARASHLDGCAVAIFPELTIDDDRLRRLQDTLATQPWDDNVVSPSGGQCPRARTPTIIVAGSWHRREGDHHVNSAPLLDGDGNLLGSIRKRRPYKGKDGRVERIEPGTELQVIVCDDCLVAVGICLDFCDNSYEFAFDRLDVDLVLVPSCGDRNTMSDHSANAKRLRDRCKGRSFIVQQAHPIEPGAVGFVLGPATATRVSVEELLESRPWSVVSA